MEFLEFSPPSTPFSFSASFSDAFCAAQLQHGLVFSSTFLLLCRHTEDEESKRHLITSAPIAWSRRNKINEAKRWHQQQNCGLHFAAVSSQHYFPSAVCCLHQNNNAWWIGSARCGVTFPRPLPSTLDKVRYKSFRIARNRFFMKCKRNMNGNMYVFGPVMWLVINPRHFLFA